MNILITGGTGFIGSRLALKLLEEGHSVKVLGQENTEAESHNNRLIKDKGAQVILASVTDGDRIFELLRGIDIVYHLAAAQHEANVPDKHFWDVNVHGTRNILEASVAAGVQRYIHGSTIGVYGSAMEGEIDEKTPPRPDNIYGVTKLESEKLALSFQDKLPIVVVRISETYGPGDRRLLKLFKGIRRTTFFLIGNGNNLHHLIYIDDLIEGFKLAMTGDSAVGKIFVLAGKEALTTNQMVTTIADVLKVQPPRIRMPLLPFMLLATGMEVALRPLGIQPPLHRRRMNFFKKSFYFSQRNATQHLDFVPDYAFREGAAETVKWYTEMNLLS